MDNTRSGRINSDVDSTNENESLVGLQGIRKPQKENINIGFLFTFATVLGLGMFQFGVVIGQWNAVNLIFSYLEDWSDS